jgi:uracil-DNA glycosylase
VARETFPGAEAFLPAERTLPALRAAAAGCRGCDLWERATQTVFGAGDAGDRLVLVGEAPGDQEDRQGRPFVGPAGRLLDEALERAGIDPAAAYRTNAVKHFRWEERGKRRIHEKPSARHVRACQAWLRAELEVVQPRVLVLLGATAAQSLLGPAFSVTRDRGLVEPGVDGFTTVATVHPSAILRARDEDRTRQLDAFVEDLRTAAARL